MKRFLLILCFVQTGCVNFPWHPFGTPITALEKKEKQVVTATSDVLNGVQADVHQTGIALDAAIAGNPRGLKVAKDFNSEATALIDQAQGAPLSKQVAKWQALNDGLLSEVKDVRADAERERETARREIGAKADLLNQRTTEKQALEVKVKDYAEKNEALADLVRKCVWAGGLIFALWGIAQILKIASPFVPALAPFSAVANGVFAPAAALALHKSETALKSLVAGVGTAVGELRVALPEQAEKIRAIFDQKLDTQHQDAVGAVANSVVGKST